MQSNETRSARAKARSCVIRHTTSLLGIVSKIRYANNDHEIGWRDHLRWRLEGLLSAVFAWAWSGSDEEIESAINGEVPLDCLSDRQRGALTTARSEHKVHCCNCVWVGVWEKVGDHCPVCGNGLWLEPQQEVAL